MEKDINRYIYIDKTSIESLYSQLKNNNRTTKITSSNKLSGNLKSELGAGLPKIISAKLNSEIYSTSMISEEYTQEVTVEDKIDSIISLQVPDGNLRTLTDVIEEIKGKSNSLVVCKSLFRFIRAYDEKIEKYVLQSDISREPSKYKELSFEFGTSPGLKYGNNEMDLKQLPINEDMYYVDMFVSGSKLVRQVRHLTHSIQYCKDFLLFVLGELSYCGKGIYYLKPFAIWRTTE